MSSAPFDFAPVLAPGLPPPAAKWTGLPKYNFIGGNNDADQVPVDAGRGGDGGARARGPDARDLRPRSGPQGYRPLREFLVAKLGRDAGIACSSDEILITSGSLQAIDLVNGLLLARGDTVLIEQESYQGSLNRLARLGVNAVGIPLDRDGHAHGCAGGRARRSQAPRHPAEIHLHHPDRAEPDRHHHGRGAPPRAAAAVGRVRRADLRGRLLRRPDLGRHAARRRSTP